MILHDFIYEWDGTKKGEEQPISWWPGAYHVRILKLDTPDSKVNFLIPTIVLLKNAKLNPSMKNTSLTNYISSFAKKISSQYNLEIEKTLWVEIADEIRVIRIKEKRYPSDPIQFALPWRPIRPNELETIRSYLDGM